MKQVKENKETAQVEVNRNAKAVSRFIRIAPRKMRVVIDTVRYKHPEQAFDILMTFKKKAARIVEKVLKSAVANAKVLGMDEARLYISDIRADGGPTMKRFMERSMGRGNRILKRTTHLSLILREGEKRLAAPANPAAKEEHKENPKTGIKPFGRKKKTASAGA